MNSHGLGEGGGVGGGGERRDGRGKQERQTFV